MQVTPSDVFLLPGIFVLRLLLLAKVYIQKFKFVKIMLWNTVSRKGINAEKSIKRRPPQVFSRVGIKVSWFVNHESICWFHEPKIRKISIFHESLFKNNQHKRCLSVCLPRAQCMRLINERKKFRNMCFGLF